jgi:hypothetical protein
MLVYLKGAESSATLRTCLRQVARDNSLHVIVYTHPDDDHQTAELGRIIGEFRPRGTDICFYEGEVEKILHARMSLAGREKLVSRDTLAALDVTPRTVQNWERRGRGPERRYRDLKELQGLLSKYIESGQVARWMDSPNEASGIARRVSRFVKVRRGI